jgi:L-ribulokinase
MTTGREGMNGQGLARIRQPRPSCRAVIAIRVSLPLRSTMPGKGREFFPIWLPPFPIPTLNLSSQARGVRFMARYALGLDFGTESVRALLVDVATGEPVATAVEPYPDGVIDERLPGSNLPLPPDWALQNPSDWLSTMEKTVTAVMRASGAGPDAVIGIGLDFTACTILPTTADGTPLHTLPAYRARPHAWAKLWKHHAAQPQADRVNALASARGDTWPRRYGGKISSEWLIPKALQMLEEDPELYDAAAHIVEGAD